METQQQIDTFHVFAEAIRQGFTAALAWGDGHLFQGAAPNKEESITERYLASFLDEHDRQHHNCSACKSFLSRYGRLQVINDLGQKKSAIFGFVDPAKVPEHFQRSFMDLLECASDARVKRIFLSGEFMLGTPVTGDWNHFAVAIPAARLHVRKPGGLTAGQRMALLAEEFSMLRRGMSEFSLPTLEAAVTIFEGGSVDRSDKFLPLARAVRDLKINTDAAGTQGRRDGLLWKAVATLPVGAARIRSSVIGTLLEDLAAGLPAAAVVAKFNAKVAPLAYQMAQAAPSTGNIAQAEKLIDAMGLRPSLERRAASLAEVAHRAAWMPTGAPGTPAPTPSPKPTKPTGVFAGLAAASRTTTPIGAAAKFTGKTLTWEKFTEHVLPRAYALEVMAPGTGPYGTLTAPVHPDAPPIFVWDSDSVEARNSYSWYKWVGADAKDFNLIEGAYCPVTAIVPTPSTWGGGDLHMGAVLVIDGAQDGNCALAGLGLFSELLRPELRPVRSTITAHNNSNALGPTVDGRPPAAGLVLRKGVPINLVLRVTAANGSAVDHLIDRWS